MKPPPFDYTAPTSVEAAIDALAQADGEAKPLAGGQSLVPLLAFRLLRPTLLVDLNRIPGLAGVRRLPDGWLAVGAMTRTRELEVSPLVRERWSLARDAAPSIGHRQIRNRGTVGGSLAHADPAAELPSVALACGCVFVAQGPHGTRSIAAGDFFVSVFTTSLAPGELLTEIRIPPRPAGEGTAFVEIARRHGDFALAGAAARVVLEDGVCVDAALVLAGVGATPIAVPAVEEILRGTDVGSRETQAAADAVRAVVEPGSDSHASAEYRRHVAAVVARRALAAAADRAR